MILPDDLLKQMLAASASDLHLASGQPPHMRVSGILRRMEFDYPIMDRMQLEGIVSKILKTESGISRLYELEEIDLTYEWQGWRFRVNIGLSQGNIFSVFRYLKDQVPSPRDLGLPDLFVQRVRQSRSGVVFVVGVTGSGKSTTLASVLGHILSEHAYRVITIEDPVEYIISSGKGMVTQREVGRDTLSFARALRAGMREDPDIILVGEVRDIDTAQNCLAAAETGHLVLATLHTGQAYMVPNRFVGMFPVTEQNLVRQRLADSLTCVMAQRLEPNGRNGLVINTEFLDGTDEVREQIVSGNIAILKKWMGEGRYGWLFAGTEQEGQS